MSTTAVANDDIRYATPEATLVDKHNLEAVPITAKTINGRLCIVGHASRMLKAFLYGVGGSILVVGSLAGFRQAELGSSIWQTTGFIALFAGLLMLVSAALIYWYAHIRRLHDLGLSAWYVLLGAVPLLGIVATCYFNFAPGKSDSNQYGVRPELTTVDRWRGYVGLTLLGGIYVLSIVAIFS